LLTKSKYHKK